MKIAVMTYHDMENYGSALQMYSLQQILTSLGCKVSIINYKKDISKIKKIVNNNKVLRLCWLYLNGNKRWIKFNKFYFKYINKTPVVSTISDFLKLNEIYDFFVAGSDQIWAPNHYDIRYFLDFVYDKEKCFSYAPSVVIDSFTENQIIEVKENISKFKNISVREKTGKDILKNKFNLESKVVLDPTLVVDSSHLRKLIKPQKTTKKTIVCYFLGNNDYIKKIEELNKQYDYDIVNISFDSLIIPNATNINDADPCEFLSYLENASLVCTDSFHGVALSIKLNKQFMVFDRFKQDDPICQNSRIYDLLEILKIKNVTYKNWKKLEYETINYKKANQILEKEVEKSLKYLKECLEK